MNLLLCPLIASVLMAQVEEPPRVEVGATSKMLFAFSWDGLSRDGSAHEMPIVKAVFRYTNPDNPAEQMWKHIKGDIALGENKIPVAEALKGIPAGKWDVQMLLTDTSGQYGLYSVVTNETRLLVTRKRPSTPQDLKVQ